MRDTLNHNSSAAQSLQATQVHRKLPRLFLEEIIAPGAVMPLSPTHTHYLMHVLRRPAGSTIRVFNSKQGEFLAILQAGPVKKQATIGIQELIRLPRNRPSPEIRLMFALIKKEPMEWMIEKATELGVTHLQPLLTARTIIRQFNTGRALSIAIEAVEQSERLDCPKVLSPQTLSDALAATPSHISLYACLESMAGTSSPFSTSLFVPPAAFIIGPEGGFTEDEEALLQKNPRIQAISLGPTILRAETAALKALALINY